MKCVVWVVVVCVIVLLTLWLLYRLLARSSICKMVEGADGRPSTSKLQWFLWTVVVISSYTAICTARICNGDFGVVSNIPQNLLIAMGLSVTTLTAAKCITVSYVANRQIIKTDADPKDAGFAPLLQDDDGFPDLSKIQMIAWTLIAIVVYLLRVWYEIQTANPQLPDIDAVLMVLMGLGQGAYLGKKLTATTVPNLTGLSPGSGKPPIEITITGASLGEKQNGSLITIDGSPFQPTTLPDWENTQIKFAIPVKQLNGSDWSDGRKVSIGVIVGGQESTNRLPFTVTPE